MIEAIKEIGRYVVDGDLTKEKFLKGISIKLPTGKKQKIVILNFDLNKEKIDVEIEDVKEDSGEKYLWVDNFKGNKPAINITSSRLDNLLTKTLPELKKKSEEDKGLAAIIQKLLDVFYKKKEYKNKNKLNYEYFVRYDKFDFSSEEKEKLEELKLSFTDSLDKKRVKSGIEKLIKAICDTILSKKGFYTKDEKEQIALYTVKITNKKNKKNEFLCKNEEYIKAMTSAKIENLFDENNRNYKKNFTENGKCTICRSNESTTSNATNLKFKFYMTDKLAFSSNFDKKFTKNFNICKECYQYLMIAENFIKRNLSTRIGGLNLYILPQFILEKPDIDIKLLSDYLKAQAKSVVNFHSLLEFREKLEDSTKLVNNFYINYLFYYSPAGKSKFKILKLIKEVTPNRLHNIILIENKINRLIRKDYHWKKLRVDLNSLWYCIPIKIDKKGGITQGHSKYLDIVDSIFTHKDIDYDFLVNQFMEVIRIIRFENESYNIETSENLVKKMLQLNFLLLFFDKLKILRRYKMEDKQQNIEKIDSMLPKEVLKYWQDNPVYEDEKKQSLFLIGLLIGKIGYAQSGSDIKNKPILNKINFQGMGVEKLIRLINELPEKLRQAKSGGKSLLNYYNEGIYSVSKVLMDKNIKKWKLSNQENVFYVLSGYAFSNFIGRKINAEREEKYIKLYKEVDEKDIDEKILQRAEKLANEKKFKEAIENLEKLKENNKEN